jgi:type IV pilus assembly protein PilF
MRALGLVPVMILLAACSTQATGPNGKKLDLAASARDRVSIAAEYLRQGDSENAQVQLSKALKLDPSSAEAHGMMGVLLERDGEPVRADKEYRRALSLSPDDSQTHNNYAIFLFKNARYKDAQKQFEAASSDLAYDRRAQAYEGLGLSWLKLNDNDAAARAFMRALKLDSELPGATLQMGIRRYAEANYDEARLFYKRYLQLTESSAQSAESLWLGIRLERRFGNKNALASYELALKNLYPDSPEYKLYQESLKAAQ